MLNIVIGYKIQYKEYNDINIILGYVTYTIYKCYMKSERRLKQIIYAKDSVWWTIDTWKILQKEQIGSSDHF